jgi:hypothetical protein
LPSAAAHSPWNNMFLPELERLQRLLGRCSLE